MRFGIVTDIHEQVNHLQRALQDLERQSVDRIICLGDIKMLGEDLEQTCQLLVDAGAIGVWGNHDLPICRDVKGRHQGKYAKAVAEYMKSLEPRLFHKELLFTHVEPWLDPQDEAAMWYCNGPPETNTDLARIFSAVTHRVIFGGHYHAWLAATPESVINWDGSTPLVLSPDQRYFIVVGAVCCGRYAIYDTSSHLLTPYTISES